MATEAVRRAKAWFEQAESDARVAAALLGQPPPLERRDVGCHVAALCAQAVVTPGTRGDKDVVNTEYPWSEALGVQAPAGASEFSDAVTLDRWVTVARRVAAELGIAADRLLS